MLVLKFAQNADSTLKHWKRTLSSFGGSFGNFSFCRTTGSLTAVKTTKKAGFAKDPPFLGD
jgi:hypothetical protein